MAHSIHDETWQSPTADISHWPGCELCGGIETEHLEREEAVAIRRAYEAGHPGCKRPLCTCVYVMERGPLSVRFVFPVIFGFLLAVMLAGIGYVLGTWFPAFAPLASIKYFLIVWAGWSVYGIACASKRDQRVKRRVTGKREVVL